LYCDSIFTQTPAVHGVKKPQLKECSKVIATKHTTRNGNMGAKMAMLLHPVVNYC